MLDGQGERRVYLVAAVGYGNNGIGYRGGLPWHCPDDLKHFRRVTMGKPVIVGYNTYLGLPHLDGRQVFLTPRSDTFDHPTLGKTDTLKILLDSVLDQYGIAMVCGGAQTYERAMPFATHMWLSRIHVPHVVCDTFFPEFNWADWNVLEQKFAHECTMFHLERK